MIARKWETRKSEELIHSFRVKVRREETALPNGQTFEDFYAITVNDEVISG